MRNYTILKSQDKPIVVDIKEYMSPICDVCHIEMGTKDWPYLWRFMRVCNKCN